MAQPTTAKFGKMVISLGQHAKGATVAVTRLDKTNPAKVTVADITRFHDNMTVTIAGALTDMLAANGDHSISGVDTVAKTFLLTGIDLSAAAAAQTTGITAAPWDGVISYVAPCGLTTKGLQLTKNLQEVNIPDCDDPDAPIWLGRDTQNMSCQISGDGVAAAESVPNWNNAAMSVDSVPMMVEIEFSSGTKTFEGDFQIDNLTFGADQGGRVTLSFTAQSDGMITDTWTPTP